MLLDHKIIEHNLDNGLKVLLYNYPGASAATFMTWYKAGSRNELSGKTGLSHFLEHMTFKRTEFFERGQITAEITRNGGFFNAYTSKDFTCYYETFSTNKLELAIIIESQRMSKVIFDDDDREKEVGVILSELEKNLDNPYSYLETALRQKAYHTHPYKNPVIGLEEDIKSIQVNDLEEYYRKFYIPNNATIVVVGNFEVNKTLELIKRYFGDISPGNVNNVISKEFSQNKIKKVELKKPGSTKIIEIGYHIPSINNQDIFPLIVLGEMLNSGVSSRIYQSLVESQITTDINVNTEINKDPGLFTLTATLFPNTTLEQAESSIFEEIQSIIDNKPLTPDELDKTKKRITSSFEFNKDGNFKLAYLLGYYETINSYKFINNYIENIQKITLNDIEKAVHQYLVPSNSTVGYFMPTHIENKKPPVNVYDYTPHETIHHIYQTPPILINEEIKSAPVNFSKKTLKNGIRILFSQNKTSDTVKLYGTINAGNLYSATVNPALPLACAGMLNRGSKNKSKIEIANQVEVRGASVGICNVGEAVNFSLSSTSQDFDYILNILGEILMKPDFPQEEFDKYKRFSIAGVKQKEDNPSCLASIAFNQIIYPQDHIFYSHNLEDQAKHIEEISLNDVKDFYNNYYSPHTLILSISGNIQEEEAFAVIEKVFGNWQPKKIPSPIIKPVFIQKEPVIKTINIEGKTESEVIFGHYGNLVRTDSDYHNARVMNFILGGSGALSSRIGKRIREDLGLVYNISSAFISLSIPGAWLVRFSVDNHYADLAIQALKEEIIKFVEYGITDSELDLAKSCLIGSYPLKFTNNTGIAKILLSNEFYNLDKNYLNEYPDIIGRITKDEINDVAKKYIHPEIACIVKAGDFKNFP